MPKEKVIALKIIPREKSMDFETSQKTSDIDENETILSNNIKTNVCEENQNIDETPSTNVFDNYDKGSNEDEEEEEEEYFPDNSWGSILSLNDGDIIFRLVSKNLDQPITCSICHTDFNNNTKYFQHKLASNKSCLIAHDQCEICDETITNKMLHELSQHFANHLCARNYYCKYCRRQECGSIIEQYEHLLLKTGIKYYLCATCGDSFTNSDQLWHHINESHDTSNERIQNNFVKVYKRYEKKHQTNNSGMTKQQCELCGIIVSNISAHIDTHNHTRKYQCELCDGSFSRLSTLEKHQQAHKKEAYKCEICGKQFYWFETFSGHMRKIHPTTNPKEYPCVHCHRKYHYKSIRDAHQNSHKKYNCEICNETVYFYPNLLLHMKQHQKKEGTKEVNRKLCKICNKNFGSIRGAINHQRICKKPFELEKYKDMQKYGNEKVFVIKSNELPGNDDNNFIKKLILKPVQFVCKQCNKCFKKETNLIQHKVDVHHKRFRCKTCGLLTDNIISHMKDHL